jgi:hypothetical protein
MLSGRRISLNPSGGGDADGLELAGSVEEDAMFGDFDGGVGFWKWIGEEGV